MIQILKWYVWITIALVLFISILLAVSFIKLSPVFVYRVLTRLDSSVDDYRFFPSRAIRKSEQSYNYEYELNAGLGNLAITYKNKNNKDVSMTLMDFVISTNSSSFIIVKDEKIIYEQYANGSERDSINTSFSMAKSVVSLLIGKAIEDGYIRSENQPVTDYIREFYGLEHISIKDLLTMRSDLYYEEKGFLWFHDGAYTYWMPDLRNVALKHKKTTDKYKGRMNYNNYHPLLLGIILERSTGMSVSEYFEQSFWKLIGSEYDASWSLDSNQTQFEKMESGINFRSVDFIKLGSMLINNGYWNGHQIINPDWIKKSTIVDFPINKNEYIGTFIENWNIGYGYMWYSRPSVFGGKDYWAWGKYDQILYISPESNIIIIRTGRNSGDVSDFSKIIEDLIIKING